MWCTCGVDVVYIWCSCDVHVLYMQYTYGVHAVYIWCTCSIHMVYMWCTCVVYMWCTFGVIVVYFWCNCGVHVVYFCCKCGVPWEKLSVRDTEMTLWLKIGQTYVVIEIACAMFLRVGLFHYSFPLTINCTGDISDAAELLDWALVQTGAKEPVQEYTFIPSAEAAQGLIQTIIFLFLSW